MAALVLKLLGGYRGRKPAGDVLRLPTRKAWALLSYLALHPGQEVPRGRLATLLWGDWPEDQARASLRQTLYELRSALGTDCADRLMATHDSVDLSADGVDVDALRFEELAASADSFDLERAVSLYGGALLDGLQVDAIDFDDWLSVERARLEELASRSLETLARTRLAGGNAVGAIDSARALVRIDPLHEEACLLLMQGLAADGRRGEALRQYRVLEHSLLDELGVAPGPDIARLRDELLENRRVDSSPRVRVPSPSHAQPATPRVDTAKGVRRDRRLRQFTAAFGIVAVAAAAGAIWFGRPGTEPPMPRFEPAPEATVAAHEVPSIAVLPFSNLSGGPRQQRLAAGLTEDLISAFSRSAQLLVVARTSVTAYKNASLPVQAIASELEVGYVLEGSVQKSDEKVRITTQLIDAETGKHVWAERYEREMSDLFTLQDDIVRHVLIKLNAELVDGAHARVASRGTTSLDAWLLRQRAMTELYKFKRASTRRTRELLRRAHELDPEWGRPLAGIAWSYWFEAKKGWSKDPDASIRKGIALAERAISLDPDDTLGYMQLGNLLQLQGQHARAIALRRKAVELAPNDFQANWGLAAVLVRGGQAERAVEVIEHAENLSPRPPVALLWTRAQAELLARRYLDAIETAGRARKLAPARIMAHIHLAAAHSALGSMDAARAAGAEVLRLDPDFSVSAWIKARGFYADSSTIDEVGRLLIAAGLPE